MDEDLSNLAEPDQSFSPDERLYRRFAFVDLITGGRIDPRSIKVTDCSFNRSKYSSPRDVFISKYPSENGCASMRVEQVPSELYCENSRKTVDVRIVHDPKEDNYSHTEIRMARRGESWTRGKNMSATIRRKMQEHLSDKLRVEIAATRTIG